MRRERALDRTTNHHGYLEDDRQIQEEATKRVAAEQKSEQDSSDAQEQ